METVCIYLKRSYNKVAVDSLEILDQYGNTLCLFDEIIP